MLPGAHGTAQPRQRPGAKNAAGVGGLKHASGSVRIEFSRPCGLSFVPALRIRGQKGRETLNLFNQWDEAIRLHVEFQEAASQSGNSG